MKKLYFYLYLFGLLCVAKHSHGSEKLKKVICKEEIEQQNIILFRKSARVYKYPKERMFYSVDKPLPGTNGKEIISFGKKTYTSNGEEISFPKRSSKHWPYTTHFNLVYWKKDGSEFKPEILHESMPTKYKPGFALGQNKIITYCHKDGSAFVWLKNQNTFIKNKFHSNKDLLLKIKAFPKLNNKEMFISHFLDPNGEKYTLKLCEIEKTAIKTILDFGTTGFDSVKEKSSYYHKTHFTSDGKTIIYWNKYWNKNKELFLWKWNDEKKSFSEKKKLDINKSSFFTYHINKIKFLPGTNGQELIVCSPFMISLYKIEKNKIESGKLAGEENLSVEWEKPSILPLPDGRQFMVVDPISWKFFILKKNRLAWTYLQLRKEKK